MYVYTSQDPSISIDGARKRGQKKNAPDRKEEQQIWTRNLNAVKKGSEQKGNWSERITNKNEREIWRDLYEKDIMIGKMDQKNDQQTWTRNVIKKFDQ